MSLRIACKAMDLQAYMKWLLSKLGKDYKVKDLANIDINYIIGQKGGDVNGATLRN